MTHKALPSNCMHGCPVVQNASKAEAGKQPPNVLPFPCRGRSRPHPLHQNISYPNRARRPQMPSHNSAAEAEELQ